MALFGKNVSIDRELEKIKAPSIQAAPIGSSQFAGAPRYQVGSNARALAQSLSKLSTSIQNYGAVAAKDASADSQFDVREYTDLFEGRTAQEIRSQFGTADHQSRSKYQKAGLAAILGGAEVSDFTRWADEQYKDRLSTDPNSGDIQNEIEAERQRRMEGLRGLHPAAGASFARGSQGAMDRLAVGEQTRLVEVIETRRDDAIQEFLQAGTTDILFDSEASPDEVAGFIIDSVEEMDLTAGLSNEKKAEHIFRAAVSFAAQGRPKLAEALLNKQRGNAGSLMGTAKYKDKSIELLEAAYDAKRTQDKEAAEIPYSQLQSLADRGLMTDQDIIEYETKFGELDGPTKSRLRRTNETAKVRIEVKANTFAAKQAIKTSIANDKETSFRQASADIKGEKGRSSWFDQNGYSTHTTTGEPAWVDGKSQRADNKAEYLRRVDASDLDDVNKMAAKLVFAEHTGEIIDEFRQTLFGGSVHAIPENLQGDLPHSVAAGLGLYLELYSRDSRVASRHLAGNEELEEFYEAARIFTLAGQRPQEALQSAFQIQQDLDPKRRSVLITELESMEDDIVQIMDDKEFTGFWDVFGQGAKVPVNTRQVARVSMSMANLYIRTGMGKAEAIEKAVRKIGDKYDVVNGYLIPTGNANIPGDFKDLAQEKIRRYWEANGEKEGIEQPEDITMMPVGNSDVAFMLINTKTGDPVEDRAGRFLNRDGLDFLRGDMVVQQDLTTIEDSEREKKRLLRRDEDAERFRLQMLERSEGIGKLGR